MALSPVDSAPAERACAGCGAPLASGQDWCVHCGKGAPGSLALVGSRSAATVLAAVLVLALGAAAAAYAALNKGAPKARVVTTTVAQATTPTATAPGTAAGTPAPTKPGATATTPKAAKGLLGLGRVKPPKIPLTALTPTPSGTRGTGKVTSTTKASTPTTTSTTPASTTPPSSKTAGETSEESQQTAILLDPDAASTYNPYELPKSTFGDPSLAIDDDPSTAWTAQVDPATAPSMAEGLLIDLKSQQKVAIAQLITSTPGMTIQFYGTDAQTAPSSITSPEWTPLSKQKVVKKKHLRIALRESSKTFTFITLWISKAPQSAVGTPQAPGHVDVNELELFPPAS
ncbi:MAG TPA: hypothetical protein VMD79_01750 [Solirubrobacteraceae bacterium]|nr:hypothetical protein [Solirubrobacteraceae bacterium]